MAVITERRSSEKQSKQQRLARERRTFETSKEFLQQELVERFGNDIGPKIYSDLLPKRSRQGNEVELSEKVFVNVLNAWLQTEPIVTGANLSAVIVTLQQRYQATLKEWEKNELMNAVF